MFCPQCRAEYRPGFHRCADCDVDLVDGPQQASRTEAPPPEKYGALLWRGENPDFYLSLVHSVGYELPCYGRPQHLTDRGVDTNYDDVSEVGPFEVWVSEPNLARAQWILDSTKEKWKEQPLEDQDAAKRPATKGESEDPIGVCPLCSAEFPTASSPCPNCNVPLHLGRFEPDEDAGARLLCELPHPQFVAELRRVLESAHIPFNNSNYSAGDIFAGRYRMPNYETVVLDSDLERATKLLARVLQHWEFEPGSGFWRAEPPDKMFWPPRAERNAWLPQDLETLVWSGVNLGSVASIAMALREHEVPYRVDDSEHGMAKIFVHRDDTDGAREILTQVLESTPPA